MKKAERVGFEPTVPAKTRWFSRPEPSTTRPPLLIFLQNLIDELYVAFLLLDKQDLEQKVYFAFYSHQILS